MALFLTILISLIVIFLLLNCYYLRLPKKDTISTANLPESFFIEVPNRIDHQSNVECAAFSSAYLLRHFGEEADGFTLYEKFPCKLPTGIIMPNGILRFFKKKHIQTALYTGTIETLKAQLLKGIPVIILIKVFADKNFLHFVPIVGYDESYLYAAESLNFLEDSPEEPLYNRKIKLTDLEKLWITGLPCHTNVYITLTK